MKNINHIFRFCFLLTFAFISFSSVATSQDACILNIAVNGSSDDAEESGEGSGNVSLTSSDLEMTYDGTREYQTVGIRFNDIQIPNGATINNAYIQFTAERINGDQTVLTIRGENTDNAVTFSEENFNISTRTTTNASVSWTPPAWNTIGAAGADQQTANIASIIEEIIGLADWNSGNSIAIIITGAEKRAAVAYDGNTSEAPVLYIEFSCDNEPVPCDDDDPSTIDVIDINGNCLHFKKVCDDGDPQTYDFFDNDGNCASKLIVCDDGDEETTDYLDEYGICHHVKTVVESCDECPDDPNKTTPGTCGCGNPEPETPCDDGNIKTINDEINGDCQCEGQLDTDLDGTPDDDDGCPTDADKTEPGECGCGNPETDTDEDGTPDCDDLCPDDPNKTEPGECGCGNLEPGTACDDGDDCTIDDIIDEACECKGVLADSDGDGTPDCDDLCPNDSNKTTPGECGCGNSDVDMDGDGVIDCVMDECPNDPDKTEPGLCGCGNPETDTDGDGTPDCNDWCPNDPNKTEDGQCGCGNPETDTDGDGTPDCNDWCPNDPNKTEDGQCGCGNPEPGTPCDDENECTINDVITEDCECRGTLLDTPECRGETCPQDPGTPCDDENECTTDDQITDECECKGTPIDTDGDGTPDCDDPCPEDPNDFCEECPADLEDCDSYVDFVSCDKVIVCLGKDISNIVVDLGPTGFQSYDVDIKFDGLSGKRWEFVSPEGATINGVWVKTAAFCGKCTDDEELYGCVDCEGAPCPRGNGSGPYYSNNLCECSEEGALDSDGDGVPDCEDLCPDDPEDECEAPAPTCSNLEGCENEVSFVTCDKVVVCTGEKINQIVVDLGPTGFQRFSVDPKFTAINDTHWEYTAPVGETIQGIWVKTKGYCDKCGIWIEVQIDPVIICFLGVISSAIILSVFVIASTTVTSWTRSTFTIRDTIAI